MGSELAVGLVKGGASVEVAIAPAVSYGGASVAVAIAPAVSYSRVSLRGASLSSDQCTLLFRYTETN